MGLLAAVRQWYKRDHAAEQRQWLSWLQHIEARVKALPSVTTEYLQPEDLSNKAPRLAHQLGCNATQDHWHGTRCTSRCRHSAHPGRWRHRAHVPIRMASSITIMPYMMDPGEDQIVADAIYDGAHQARSL